MLALILPSRDGRSRRQLGQRRANYIAKSLVERGIKESQIQIKNFGGIDKYEANEANRTNSESRDELAQSMPSRKRGRAKLNRFTIVVLSK
ncbi:MAG: hypothetical protein PUD56_03415 [Prevotella sp.]|nr:hypothetical protein [Prevotella sp.]